MALSVPKGRVSVTERDQWALKVEGLTDEEGIASFDYCVEDWTGATPGDVVLLALAVLEDDTPEVAVTVNIVGPPAFITITATPDALVCGESSVVVVHVTDAIGQRAIDGTEVELTTNYGGVLAPPNPITVGGNAIAYLLTSEAHAGPYVLVGRAGYSKIWPGITAQLTISALRNGWGAIRTAAEEQLASMVRARPLSVAPDGDNQVVKTVLFTDIEGSSALNFRLGNIAWAAIRRQHDDLISRIVEEHDGLIVKPTGDGFYCVFDRPYDAARGAKACQRALDDFRASHVGEAAGDLHVRMGLATGEVGPEKDDFFGAAVIIAQRVMSQARGSQIMAADTTRGILAGRPDLVFVDGELFEPKGYSKTMMIYRLIWEMGASPEAPSSD